MGFGMHNHRFENMWRMLAQPSTGVENTEFMMLLLWYSVRSLVESVLYTRCLTPYTFQ